MEIKLRQYSFKPIYVIDITGEMDLYNSYKVKEFVQQLMDQKKQHFILNLEGLNYIDSGGIGSLINIFTMIKKENLKLQITNVHGSVRRVIELTKLLNYFPISENIDSAVAKLEHN
jgi:anti-sigma B factor antagonist